MKLKVLLLSSDEKTVRILRRVLSDLEIEVEHCSLFEDGIRQLTRRRFEAIVVDCTNSEKASGVVRAAKAAPVNKRALSIMLVESTVGLKGGFDMGAHFVLHKPLSVERAKASFRAVRALMKHERRRQLRVPVQVPIECVGVRRYHARTLDLCEGGMAIKFTGRVARESALRFSLELPSADKKLEIWGEVAWEGQGDQAGVRFKNVTEDQRHTLRNWLNRHLPELEPDDPPVVCRLTNVSLGGCYLTSTSPFPKATRVILSMRSVEPEVCVAGIVRISHPEFGMGVEFVQSTAGLQDQARRMTEILQAGGEPAEIHVHPDGMDSSSSDETGAALSVPHANDVLLDLFRQHSQVPVDVFLQQMQQRHPQGRAENGAIQ